MRISEIKIQNRQFFNQAFSLTLVPYQSRMIIILLNLIKKFLPVNGVPLLDDIDGLFI